MSVSAGKQARQAQQRKAALPLRQHTLRKGTAYSGGAAPLSDVFLCAHLLLHLSYVAVRAYHFAGLFDAWQSQVKSLAPPSGCWVFSTLRMCCTLVTEAAAGGSTRDVGASTHSQACRLVA
jgi:hypothetical protein